MNLTLFSNSTGLRSYNRERIAEGKSYIERLSEHFSFRGRQIDGFTALHLRNECLSHFSGKNKIILIHLGACEALSHPPENYLEWAISYMNYSKADFLFMKYFALKMRKAAHDLTHKINKYYKILDSFEFENLMDDSLTLLQGAKIIVVGMSQPADENYSHWFSQAWEYEEVFKKLQKKHNFIFIEVWHSCKSFVVDSNHLSFEGHEYLFNQLFPILKENENYE